MINFEKWHGNGNDFVIVNSIEQGFKLTKGFIKKIGDRNKGIGFDQLILIGLPTKHDHDFFIRFYNSDGSEADNCLNGIRCASSYIWKNNLAPKNKIIFKTKQNEISSHPKQDNNVSVNITKPVKHFWKPEDRKKLEKIIGGDFFSARIGNNHFGIKMDSIQKVDLDTLYSKLKKFIKISKFNLSIYAKKDKFVEIRTFENGVGETLSCGSAALCVASHLMSKDKRNKVIIRSIGGKLKFQSDFLNILMSGPTDFIYKGNIDE